VFVCAWPHAARSLRRGAALSWNSFSASTGFDACKLLDVGQNALTSTLPSGLGQIGNSSRLGLSLYDNRFSGTVPASYASLSWLALAYNPLLVGALPMGVNTSKLFAWSGYNGAFYPWSSAAVTTNQGSAPAFSTGYLYGTSIGLDRPLVSILLDIKAAVDPSGAVLSAWSASQLQPCRPWQSGIASYQGQWSGSPVYGSGWRYVSTLTSVAGSAEYCQDVGSSPNTSPTTTAANAALAGGVAALWLQGLGLNGTLPCALGQLRTATTVSLASNGLRGFLPPALVGMSAVTAVNLQLNQLGGSIPAEFGACACAARPVCALATSHAPPRACRVQLPCPGAALSRCRATRSSAAPIPAETPPSSPPPPPPT
jgi:hypothetical protein